MSCASALVGLPRASSAKEGRCGRALVARPYRPSLDPLLAQGVPKELIREGPPSTREPGKAGAPSEEVVSRRERALEVEDIVFLVGGQETESSVAYG